MDSELLVEDYETAEVGPFGSKLVTAREEIQINPPSIEDSFNNQASKLETTLQSVDLKTYWATTQKIRGLQALLPDNQFTSQRERLRIHVMLDDARNALNNNEKSNLLNNLQSIKRSEGLEILAYIEHTEAQGKKLTIREFKRTLDSSLFTDNLSAKTLSAEINRVGINDVAVYNLQTNVIAFLNGNGLANISSLQRTPDAEDHYAGQTLQKESQPAEPKGFIANMTRGLAAFRRSGGTVEELKKADKPGFFKRGFNHAKRLFGRG